MYLLKILLRKLFFTYIIFLGKFKLKKNLKMSKIKYFEKSFKIFIYDLQTYPEILHCH